MSGATPVPLPTFEPTSAPPRPAPSSSERDRLIGRVKLLSWASLAWMTVEGTVAIVASP